jgi:gliding motility-associated-like protein
MLLRCLLTFFLAVPYIVNAQLSCTNWLNTPAIGSIVTVGDLDVTGNQLTVEAVFNRTVPLNNGIYYGHLVSKHTGPGTTNYALLPNGCEIETDVSGYKSTFQNCVPDLNKTYHVAMVYDGTSLKFYRNGFLHSQTPCTGNLITNNLATTIAQISSSGNPPNNQFLGYVNEVRIWNVARTQNQIRTYMNSSLPAPTTQSGLVGYYTFDNLLNKQGNAVNNGTSLGGAAINTTNSNCSFVADSCRVVPLVIPDFTIPDTVCVNTPVNITNTTTDATSQFWNFCAGNINQTPVGTNLGAFGGVFSMPVYLDYVQENGNYYGFLTNYAPGKLFRLDFGNSLLNIPTVTDLGNVGGVIPLLTEGIQVIKNEGRWYAIIVAGYTPFGSTPRVLKIDFGSNITNPSPVGIDWGNIGNLLQPVDLHVFQEAGNWYGFTVNAENNTITRFNFTNSFNNTPTAINLGNIGNLSYPTGIYAIKDGVNWRVFITNAGNNTRTSGTFSLSRLDFGSSLLSTPTGVNLGNPGGLLRHPRDLTILKYCDQITGFAVNGFLNEPDLVRLDFNNDLTSIPTITSLGNTGNLSFPHSLSKIFRVDADLYSFITNVDNGTITRLQFTGCNNSSVPNFSGPNPPPVTYNTPGTYNINLTVDDGLATQASICKQVVVLANPAITISNDTAICRNSSVQLQSSGGGSYTWTPHPTLSNPAIANPTASPMTNTTYYLTVTNSNNCSSFDSVKVNIISPAQFSVGPAETICINESVQLNASGGTVYSWTPSTGLDNSSIANPIANPQVSTNYTVIITEPICNESSSLTVPVNVLSLPTVNAITSNDIDCTMDFAQLAASGAQDYSWSPANGLNNPNISSPIAKPVITTQYVVTGTDASGCINRDSVIVNVSANGKSGYLMPSAFTPNNDGLNDCFGIKYWGAILELEFNIFNRWGERVFHTTNPFECWNGRFRGVEQKEDVYVYWIRAKTACESSVFRKGVVMLIR